MLNLTKEELKALKQILKVELDDLKKLSNNLSGKDKTDMLSHIDVVNSIYEKIEKELN